MREVHINGRLQGGALFDLVQAIWSDARLIIGNIELRRDMDTVPQPFTYQETLRQLTPTLTVAQLRTLREDARRAQQYGQPTQLQLSILFYSSALNAEYTDAAISNTVTKHISWVTTRLMWMF